MASSLTDSILSRLYEAAGQPVSGEGLARQLGVTRAAIWKGVAALRADGYGIESLPARGYRLGALPGGVRPGELETLLEGCRLGHPLRYFEVTDSTNRQAEIWAAEGVPEGALVVAEHQQAGRGRLQRNWYDAPGQSLLFSLILRPAVPTAVAPMLTFAAAVALAEALATWVPPDDIAIKWPNDVLVGNRKVAGILLEMRVEAQRVEHVIVGVGVNVGGSANEFPEEIRHSGITLTQHAPRDSGATRRGVVLREYLKNFEELYEDFLQNGPGGVTTRWNRWFRLAGQWIRVQTPAGKIEGIALGLGQAGALRIDTGAATTREIYAGDVEWATTREVSVS